MLNKELLMMGGAEELWTLQATFTGDSSIDLTLWDSTDKSHILWKGNPNTGTVTVRITPKSTLLLTHSVGRYGIITEDGCLVEDFAKHEIAITVYQIKASLEMVFRE